MPPGETPNRVSAREKADRQYDAALKILDDEGLSENRQAAKYCQRMVAWATLMVAAEPAKAISWSREAADWSKRLDAAREGVYRDELSEINAKLERFNTDADRLRKLRS